MKLFKSFVFVCATVLGLNGAVAFAQNTALVIGLTPNAQGNTRNNLSNDLTGVVASLENAGVDTKWVFDQSVTDTLGEVIAYARDTRADDSRIVFLSGPTLNIGGQAYLVANDQQRLVNSLFELNVLSVPLNGLVAALSADGVPTLLVLDSGYDHSIDDDFLDSGLVSQVEVTLPEFSASGSLSVLYAHTPSALNRGPNNNRNKFAEVFADQLTEQGQSMDAFARNVAARTQQESRNRQTPDYRTVGLDFQVGGQPEPVVNFSEQRLWELAVGQDETNVYEAYLELYPDGFYAAQALAALDRLAPSEVIDPIGTDYVIARRSNLRAGPGTEFTRVSQLEANALVFNIGQVRGTRWYKIETRAGVGAYIFDSLVYPYEGSDLQAWNTAVAANSIEGYVAYLNAQPQGQYRDQAQAQIQAIEAERLAQLIAQYRIRPLNDSLIINRSSNVRSIPDTSGALVARLSAGDIVPVTGESALVHWYQIELDGRIAFIWKPLGTLYSVSIQGAWERAEQLNTIAGYQSFLDQYPNSEYTPTAQARISFLTPEPTPAPQDPGQLLVDNFEPGEFQILFDTPVRNRARARAAILGNLETGQIVEASSITNDGEWYRVVTSFGTGFVSTAAAEPYVPRTFTARVGTNVMTSNTLLYPQTFERGTALGRLDTGTQVIVTRLSNNGEWALLEESRFGRGWLPADALAPIDASLLMPRSVLISDGTVYSRTLERGDNLGTLDAGIVVTVDRLSNNNQWAQVTGNGIGPGWLPVSVLRPATSADRLNRPAPVTLSNFNARVVTTETAPVFDRPLASGRQLGTIRPQTTIQVNTVSSDRQWYGFTLQSGDSAFLPTSSVVLYDGSDKQQFEAAAQANTVAAFQAYLDANPNGAFRNQAIEQIQRLNAGQTLRFNLGGLNFDVNLN